MEVGALQRLQQLFLIYRLDIHFSYCSADWKPRINNGESIATDESICIVS